MMIKFIILFLLLISNVQANTRDGLVGWWKFDEATNGNAIDSSNNGNIGTAVATSVVNSCARSNCRNFDGINDYITVANSASIQNISPFTISFWIYKPVLNAGNLIIAKGYGFSTIGWSIENIGTNQLGFRVGYSTTSLQVRSANNLVTLGFWQNFIITWDGSTTAANVHMYANNIESASYPTATNGSGTRGDDSADTLSFGARNNGTLKTNERLDDIRIYNRILTAQERLDIYNQGIRIRNATINNAKLNF